MGKAELDWGQYKRQAEKYIADPGEYKDLSGLQEMKKAHAERYRSLIGNVRSYMAEKGSPDKIKDPRFKLWFQRQEARNRFQSSISRHMEGMYYIPAAFELTDGCSIGCDFCCLAAKRLSAVYRHTGEHAREWKDLLGVMRETLGDFAGAGLCYFATEPFDNPDYEQFLQDFYDINGYIPQTTTAAADRDIERTRTFLKNLGEEELAHAAVRFSVTSLKQLEKIHRAFTPEELYYVELLMNNPESVNAYSRSGRSIGLSDQMESKQFLDNISNICTCGFVTNMPRHTVMLVSAHRPGERYPLGMRILEKRTFRDPAEYRTELLGMIERWMPREMPKDSPMETADFVSWEQSGFRIKIRGDKISRAVTTGAAEQEGFRMLVRDGISVNDILTAVPMTEYEKARFLKNAELFYKSGYLEERREKNGMESGKDQ